MSVFIIRDLTGETLHFDAVIRESHRPTRRATKHAIETGALTTDHVIRDNNVFNVVGVVSASPMPTSPTAAIPGRMEAANSFLDSLDGEFCTVVSSEKGTFLNCLILGWPHEVNSVKQYVFDIRVEQVQIATAGFVTIPPSAPVGQAAQSGFSDAVDVGEQATSVPSDAAAASDKSWIIIGLEGVGAIQ